MASIECVVEVLDLFMRSDPQGSSRVTDVDKTVQAWLLVLEPLPDEVVAAAALDMARAGWQYGFPKAGDLYRRAAAKMDGEPSAEDAWALVVKRARNFRGGDPLRGRAALAAEAIDGVKVWSEEELPFRRKEFLEAYEGLTERWTLSLAATDPSRLLGGGSDG